MLAWRRELRLLGWSVILDQDRKIVIWLVKLRLWKIVPDSLWPIAHLRPCWGTNWLHKRMVARQTRDGLHHAPACRGNEWSGAHLVLQYCTCGAARQAAKDTP